MSRFRPPVRAKGDGFLVALGDDESAVAIRLIDELRALLNDPDPDTHALGLLERLFPVCAPGSRRPITLRASRGGSPSGAPCSLGP